MVINKVNVKKASLRKSESGTENAGGLKIDISISEIVKNNKLNPTFIIMIFELLRAIIIWHIK